MERHSTQMALVAVGLVHAAVAVAHGSAHASAGVALDPVTLAFVLAVIQAGPLAGLLWMIADPRRGARLVTFTLSAALLFGLIKHFVVPGADRVDFVAHASRAWFEATAILLVVTEAAGAALGVACGWRPARRAA